MNNIKVVYIFILSFFILPVFSKAQLLDHKLGEFIIQVSDHYDARMAFKELNQVKKNEEKLTIERVLVPDLGIFLLSVDFTKVNEIEMLRFLRKQKFIKLAQFNHLIEYRNTPNDPQFPQQWQYINDGSNNGTAGADFDIDLAWDITTGGLSPNGDSIVICVIDEGFQTEHNDLKDNLWINHLEIPDNRIDDDGNGYEDDYQGWNTYTDNDNMGLIQGHGTPVAGIVGAKGNNDLGVAGVNWNVKVMLVVGGGEEALALAAYAYPYSFRKKYNETGGEEGAFVVATNASWGVPGLKEADAPIWCSFYDSLGEQGIINMAATENRNLNVDEVGDLPASCSSDFLIAVTNVDRTGEKYGPAGYGSTHIDLGSFGAQTYSITANNGYGSFGGTSAATPHVTGTVGLIYSAPCPALSSLALNDPESAARLTRQYLLEGVVPITSLEGKTVTGGRLNINNTLQLVLDDCDPCPSPGLIKTTAITDEAITLDWVETDSIQKVDLYWRTIGSTEWNIENEVTKPFEIQNLLSCQNYEFQLQSFCQNDTSDFSKILQVETDGCCRPPSDLTISDRSNTSAMANWSAILAAQSYNIRHRMIGENNWMTQNTQNVNILLDNLIACADYEVQIQTVCDTGSTAFSPSINFGTLGCGSCLDFDYCESDGSDASGEWIAGVAIDNWENESGTDDGFGDFTGLNGPSLMADSNYQIILTPGYATQNWSEYFRVWIDFNQDGLFNEETEMAYDRGESVNAPDTGIIVIPSSAKEGLTRMRVSMEFVGFANENRPTPCDDNIEFGEVEDYCVMITQAPCPSVSEVSGSFISPVAATLSWDVLAEDLEFELEYHVLGEIEWESISLTTNEFRLSGLLACNSYEARVLTKCGTTNGGYSPIYQFNTTCPCVTPTALDTISVSDVSADLSWENSINSDAFLVRFREIGATNWSPLEESNDTSFRINNLELCTEYEYQIQAKCFTTQSNFSESFTFKTACTTSIFSPSAFAKLDVFPNPFLEELTLDINLNEAANLDLQLFNVQGQLIKTLSLNDLPKGESRESLNWSDLSQGVYFLRISGEEEAVVRRLIKHSY